MESEEVVVPPGDDPARGRSAQGPIRAVAGELLDLDEVADDLSAVIVRRCRTRWDPNPRPRRIKTIVALLRFVLGFLERQSSNLA